MRSRLVLRAESVRGGEFEPQSHAGHEGEGREDEASHHGGLDGALQPVPRGRGYAAELGEDGVTQVEDDETEIGVASEKVGGVQGFGGSAGAHPDEVFEKMGRPGGRIEGVAAVNQRDAQALGAHDVQELPEKELAAAAWR